MTCTTGWNGSSFRKWPTARPRFHNRESIPIPKPLFLSAKSMEKNWSGPGKRTRQTSLLTTRKIPISIKRCAMPDALSRARKTTSARPRSIEPWPTPPGTTRSAQKRLGLARALRQSGLQAEATAILRDVLNLSWSVTDASGISYAMYAAVGLTRMNRTNDVLNRAKRDLESPNASQAAQLQSVLKTLSASNDKAIRQDVSAALGRLSSRMDNLAQARSLKEAHDLQRDFASMRVTESIWKPYPGPGGELWLVGRTPKGAASLPLAVVVRAEAVRRSVETDRSGHGGTAFRITTGGETGESLGDRLHELKVELPPEAGATAAADSGLRQSFYGLSLFVVVPLTFLGGYLLWRDMVAPADWPKIVTLFGSPGPGVRSCPMNDDRIPGSNHNAR